MYLKAFNRQEHDVTTVFLRGEYSDYVKNAMDGHKVIFFELGTRSLRGIKLQAVCKVIALCRRERFDVAIAHRYKPIYVAGIASLFSPFKLLLGVAHEHDVFSRLGRRLFLKYWRPKTRVVGVSTSVKQDIVNCCKFLEADNRVHVLPNCIDGATAQDILTRADAREQLGLDPDSYVFGTIGRTVRKKEHEVLIQSICDERLSKCVAIIIGGGSRTKHLQQIATELGVSDRVIFSGHVHQAFKYVRAFDAFVLPSGEKEAFGLVLLEAMMAKVPIICSDAKGPKEVVKDTGMLFMHGNSKDLADKMVLLRSFNQQQIDVSVEHAFARLQRHYLADSFKRRFWDLPSVRQFQQTPPESGIIRMLNRLYEIKDLPLTVRHSLYRKLRRRGVSPSEEFASDFFGYTYRGNVKNQIDADVYFFGCFEKPMLLFLRDFMRGHPGVFVDVGANVGNHSLFMSLHAERVHSFEPFPPVLDQFQGQITSNRICNIDVHRVALGNQPGEVPFYAPPVESLGGGSFVESVAEKHGRRPVTKLPVVRGDEYFPAHGVIPFKAIKIDVEGFEIPVLEGLRKTLETVRPLIVMEVTHGATDEIETTTEIELYLPKGYKLFRFENRDDRLFRNQSRARKRTGQYRLFSLSERVHKKRADVVACPVELLAELPMSNRL
jgi:FkbM family methyltransferase